MLKKIFFSLLFFYSTLVWAERITAYTIDIGIEQSGELSIKEFIDYDFGNNSKHGIFRDIPFTIKYNGYIKDIELSNFTVRMDNKFTNWEQSIMNSTHAGKIIRLKIGDAHSYVTGKHRYMIFYHVKKGVLPSAQNKYDDAIRWNIIGTGWEVPIQNVTANFYLPPSLKQQMIILSTYTGIYGSMTSSAESKWITPQHLQVMYLLCNPTKVLQSNLPIFQEHWVREDWTMFRQPYGNSL